MQTQAFRITNITCEACVKLSTQALQELPTVSSVSVDAVTGNTQLQSASAIPWDDIVAALAEVGKTVAQTV